MKRTIQLMLWLLCCAIAHAQGTFVVVPGGLANAEGNSSMTEPFNSPSFRMQMVIDASEFAFLGGGTGLITSIAFRVDGPPMQHAVYSYGGGLVQVSTTTRGPDSLSPVFEENIGPDVRTLISGPLTFGTLHEPGAQPQPFFANFDPVFFTYSPSMGNLLLDIGGVSGIVGLPGALDAQSSGNDGISRVFAPSHLAQAGTLDSLGLVMRFDVTVVPEPEPAMLCACLIGVLLLFSVWRK